MAQEEAVKDPTFQGSHQIRQSLINGINGINGINECPIPVPSIKNDINQKLPLFCRLLAS
jgi:hypothetical protein